MAAEPLIISFDDCPEFSPVPGSRMQGAAGERLHANRVFMEPGAEIPEHAHENEQLGCVISGSCFLHIGGQQYELRAGMLFSIPSNVPHMVKAGPEGCMVIDIFTPPRDDFPATRAGQG